MLVIFTVLFLQYRVSILIIKFVFYSKKCNANSKFRSNRRRNLSSAQESIYCVYCDCIFYIFHNISFSISLSRAASFILRAEGVSNCTFSFFFCYEHLFVISIYKQRVPIVNVCYSRRKMYMYIYLLSLFPPFHNYFPTALRNPQKRYLNRREERKKALEMLADSISHT